MALLDRGGKQLWKYITREPIRSVAVSDVGGFVAAGCDDAQVYFFDRRGLLLWRYKCDQRVTGVGVSRDGNVLAAGSEDQGVYYFDNRNTPRRFVWKLRMEGVVNSVAIVPSGENILAGAQDGGIFFMDSREGAVIWKAFARAPVLCVAASKFADVMAAGADDGSLHCFDFGGKLLWERQTAGAILDVSLDNRGAFVAALSKDGTLYCFDAKGGALLWSHPTGSDGGRVKLTKNGDLVFVDMGACVGGYWADFSRAAVIGRATDHQLRMQELVAEVTELGTSALAPGRTTGDVARLVDAAMEERGLVFTSRAERYGHGMGMAVTERPDVWWDDETPIVPGMVLTMEPGMWTEEGMFHCEQNVVVTTEGNELLSRSPLSLTEVG